MTIHNVYAGEAAKTETKPFELPKGVTVGDDGELVDNRSWYQTRLTGNSTLASLKEQHDKSKKDKAGDKKEEGYTWKTPFTWVKNIFTGIFGFIGDMFKSIFGICFNYEDKADKAEATKEKKDETPKTEKK